MEFKLIPFTGPDKIEFNYEEIKVELAVMLKNYVGLVYNDEDIKLAKSDRASLNRFKDAIENERKKVKATCMIPYDQFEAKIKDIVSMVNEPIAEIDKQIKAYDQAWKENKRQLINEMYDQLIGKSADRGLSEIIPLDKIFDQKWLNATVNLGTVQKELQSEIERIQVDLSVIESWESRYVTEIKAIYMTGFSMREALAAKLRMEDNEKRIAAIVTQSEQKVSVQEPVKCQTEIEPEQLDFRVWVNTEQKQALKQFLLSNNIKYGKVPVQCQEQPVDADPVITQDKVTCLWTLAGKAGIDEESLRKWIKKEFYLDSTRKLKVSQWRKVCFEMDNIVARQESIKAM